MKKVIYRSIYLLMLLPLLQCNSSKPGINKINHIIIIYLENRSFDNLYGRFPNANGLNNDSKTYTQKDSKRKAYDTLPIPKPNTYVSKAIYGMFTGKLPNKPFNINKYVSYSGYFPDLKHRYLEEQEQIDSGKMDKFAQINSNSLGLAMGYDSTVLLPLYKEAKKYVLCDNFFHG